MCSDRRSIAAANHALVGPPDFRRCRECIQCCRADDAAIDCHARDELANSCWRQWIGAGSRCAQTDLFGSTERDIRFASHDDDGSGPIGPCRDDGGSKARIVRRVEALTGWNEPFQREHRGTVGAATSLRWIQSKRREASERGSCAGCGRWDGRRRGRRPIGSHTGIAAATATCQCRGKCDRCAFQDVTSLHIEEFATDLIRRRRRRR